MKLEKSHMPFAGSVGRQVIVVFVSMSNGKESTFCCVNYSESGKMLYRKGLSIVDPKKIVRFR